MSGLWRRCGRIACVVLYIVATPPITQGEPVAFIGAVKPSP